MERFLASTPIYSGNSKAFLETFLVESVATRPRTFAGLAEWDTELLASLNIDGFEAIDLDNRRHERAHILAL